MSDVVQIAIIVVASLSILSLVSLAVWLIAVKVMFKQFDKTSNKIFKDF